MSKSLTVLLTASRSSARSAPISYTPPVKPPPPSTSAVLLGRRRARRARVRRVVSSSLTTLPIPPFILVVRAPAPACTGTDRPLRARRRGRDHAWNDRHGRSPHDGRGACGGRQSGAPRPAGDPRRAYDAPLPRAAAGRASSSACCRRGRRRHGGHAPRRCSSTWHTSCASRGTQSGAYVYDMTTGKALFAERATQHHPPASVEKLYTAVTALERMGPTAQLETTRARRRPPRAGGRVAGRPLPARRRRPDVRQQRVHPRPLRRRGHLGVDARGAAEGAEASGASPGGCRGTSPTSTRCAASPPAATRGTPSSKATSARWRSTAGKPATEKGAHAPAALRGAPAARGAAGGRRGGRAAAQPRPGGTVQLAAHSRRERLLGMTLRVGQLLRRDAAEDLGAAAGD